MKLLVITTTTLLFTSCGLMSTNKTPQNSVKVRVTENKNVDSYSYETTITLPLIADVKLIEGDPKLTFGFGAEHANLNNVFQGEFARHGSLRSTVSPTRLIKNPFEYNLTYGRSLLSHVFELKNTFSLFPKKSNGYYLKMDAPLVFKQQLFANIGYEKNYFLDIIDPSIEIERYLHMNTEYNPDEISVISFPNTYSNIVHSIKAGVHYQIKSRTSLQVENEKGIKHYANTGFQFSIGIDGLFFIKDVSDTDSFGYFTETFSGTEYQETEALTPADYLYKKPLGARAYLELRKFESIKGSNIFGGMRFRVEAAKLPGYYGISGRPLVAEFKALIYLGYVK